MVDNRIYTFLELCNVMNYHKTAENLNMTQPAVTQHIKYLEGFYGCKLFDYSARQLKKTKKCTELEKYARNIISLSESVKEELLQNDRMQINIGATKTIGEYTLDTAISSVILDDDYELNFIIDNTENLLNRLNHFELDLILVEGYVDKEKYLHTQISTREVVGICSLEHKFAFNEVTLQDIMHEKILLREKGSGTRSVFENFLSAQGYKLDSLKNKAIISSNKIIEETAQKGQAISFVYDVMQRQNPNIAYFKIAGNRIMHEFNYVYLNRTKAQKIMGLLNLFLQ